MTKAEFIAKYKDLITVRFNYKALADNPAITITESNRALTEFLEFYVPRYAKAGSWDNRDIGQIAPDASSVIVRLQDVLASPAAWGLRPFSNARRLGEVLWPVPIATDAQSGKTLILDSNHTICTLLTAGMNIDVPCVEVSGDNLAALGPDLKLMQT